jgi:hypothetical protein
MITNDLFVGFLKGWQSPVIVCTGNATSTTSAWCSWTTARWRGKLADNFPLSAVGGPP